MPVPGKWHRWVHSVLEGAAGVTNPQLELIAFQKQKVEVWREESLVWCRHLLRGPRLDSPLSPLCRRGLSLPTEGPSPLHPSWGTVQEDCGGCLCSG